MEPKEIDKKIGEKIAINRKLKNKSRGWLAEKVSRSYQQVQNYESGKHRVAASCLLIMARALKTPIINFFPKDDEK
tara:strand:+ start:1514 stop:1741 length:228 start_codon:yes stop_codon:yes gene_type:complete